MGGRKVVLLEFVDEAECLISYCRKQQIDINSLLIVALSAKVQAYLNKKNIRYSNTLKYFDNRAQETIIKKNEEILSYFIRSFSASVSLIEDFIFYIRFYIYHYLWIIEILDNIKQREVVDSLLIIKSPLLVSESSIINERERYLPTFCQKFCIENKIDYTIIENTAPFFSHGTKTNKILQKTCEFLAKLNLDKISKSKSPSFAVYSLSYNFGRLVNHISSKHSSTKCIILGELDVSLRLLFALLLQLINLSPKRNVIYLPVNIFADETSNQVSFSAGINASFNADIFYHHGVSFKEELQAKIKTALIPYLDKLNSHKKVVESIYEKTKPVFVLSQIGIGLGRILGEVSLNHDVPSIFISHGSHKVPTNGIEYIELFNLSKGFMLSEFAYATISSPFIKKHFDYFKTHYPRMRARPIISGPLIFSKMGSKKKPIINKNGGEKIILHATTIKTRGTDRFYILETNDEFFSAVNDLIEIVDSVKNVKLLVRFHPGFPLSEEEIRSLLKPSEKLIISLSGPFQDVLAVSDVLISYSSTAIEEALLNFIPVVLYDKWSRYNHLDAQEFKDDAKVSCAYYVTNKNDLKNCINLLLHNREIIDKECYYRYVYKEDYNPSFYNFISKLLSKHNKEEQYE